MNLLGRQYSKELVGRVNELYHDLFSHRYHGEHPEITLRETERWQRIAGRYFKRSGADPLRVADIGTGTGFVPLTTAGRLACEDLFICCDVSAGMLEQAQRNLARSGYRCRFEFRKSDPAHESRVPLEDCSTDIITLNSVLHHIKDTGSLLREFDRALKPGGLLIIAHEPNLYFTANPLLKTLSLTVSPRMLLDRLALRFTLFDRLKKAVRDRLEASSREAESHGEITAEINRKLLAEKLVSRELLPEEIKLITDIHALSGFYPDRLLPDYQLVELHTYCYLGADITPLGAFARTFENVMNALLPKRGAQFVVVLRKPA